MSLGKNKNMPNTSRNNKDRVRVSASNNQPNADRPFNRLLADRDEREAAERTSRTREAQTRMVKRPANNMSANTSTNASGVTAQSKQAVSKSGIQQIMELLKEFNQRLKRDELERERLWKEMDSLQSLIDHQKEKMGKADPQVEKWKRVMEDNQRALHTQIEQTKALQIEMSSRVETVETASGSMALRFDDVLSEQKRLTRRVDTAVENKTRLLKKMETLEDELKHTQDTLRAKALVLLTDQATANKTSLPQSSTLDDRFSSKLDAQKPEAPADADPLLGGVVKPSKPQTNKKSAVNLNTTATASISNDIHPFKIDERKQRKTRLGYYATAASVLAIIGVVSAIAVQQQNNSSSFFDVSKITQLSTSTPSAQSRVPARATSSDALDGLDMTALAPQMNAIEPGMRTQAQASNSQTGNNPVNDAPVLTSVQDLETATPETVARVNQTKVSDLVKADERSAISFMTGQVETGDLETIIGRDNALSAQVKTVEDEALAGNPAAQHDLAAIYAAGHGGVTTNYEKAAQWFEQAAVNGVANARYNLGVLYQQGLGVEKSDAYAIELYKAAASLGHPEAQYNLGIAYIEGVGVKQNVAKAAHYFEEAATNDVMEASYNLGLIYENGLLGKQQPDEALFWYKVASSKGSLEGRQALESLAKELELNPSDVDALISRIAVLKPNVNILLGGKRPSASSRSANEPTSSQTIYSQAPAASEQTQTDAAATQANTTTSTNDDAVIVAQIQDQLINLGMYPGPADGIVGPVTTDAVRTYQQTNGLSVDGEASEDLLVHMLAREFELNTYPSSGVFQDVGSQE